MMEFTWILVVWLAVLGVVNCQIQFSASSPFFTFCNFPTRNKGYMYQNEEVKMQAVIHGDPQYFEPGKYYRVSITSNVEFDMLWLTGHFFRPNNYKYKTDNRNALHNEVDKNAAHLPYLQQMFLPKCQIVHSHMASRPSSSLTFVWAAPPRGAACIQFMTTALRHGRIIYKGIVKQLCEKGVNAIQESSSEAVLYVDDIVIRDDFESGTLHSKIWNETQATIISNNCQSRTQHSLLFCKNETFPFLVSQPLNLSQASGLNFVLGGDCDQDSVQQHIVVSYALSSENCTYWKELGSTSLSSQKKRPVSLHLPPEALQQGTCLKWNQSHVTSECWSLDNVLITTDRIERNQLHDNFDHVNTKNWLFSSGGQQKLFCGSDKNAMVFEDGTYQTEQMSTHDLNLSTPIDTSDVILSQTFDTPIDLTLSRWVVNGASNVSSCHGLEGQNSSIRFDMNGTRQICTPFLNIQDAQVLQFHLNLGPSDCTDDVIQEREHIFVYREDKNGNTHVIKKLTYKEHHNLRYFSLKLPDAVQVSYGRLCWLQKAHRGWHKSMWSMGRVNVLHDVPATPVKYIQFNLNIECNKQMINRSVKLLFSTDYGFSWNMLHQPCLPGNDSCYHSDHYMSSAFSASEMNGWSRITLPLPLAALTQHVRFSWMSTIGNNVSWALDNVFIGSCPGGCSGHGQCMPSGCVCDLEHLGSSCNRKAYPNPAYLIETMSQASGNQRMFKTTGASLGFECGVVGSGKALVFKGNGMRNLETVDLNTTISRYLQFSIRIGSASLMGSCPGPDDRDKNVLLYYSCSGGITWNLLKVLAYDAHQDPGMVSVILPSKAMKTSCMFRWWQPVHAGANKDVWAIDDIVLINKFYNTVSLDFNSPNKPFENVHLHLGEVGTYCGRPKVLRFDGPTKPGESRYLQTDSLHIGSSYICQFELMIGCMNGYTSSMSQLAPSDPPSSTTDVHLEYSLNHGITWTHVKVECLPPKMCVEYTESSVYRKPSFTEWKVVTVKLSSDTWSSGTRVRISQQNWSLSDSWSIGHFYIGPACPENCNGHGKCVNAVCRCDSGHHGVTCQPSGRLQSSLHEDFTVMATVQNSLSQLRGGNVKPVEKGCGTILSGESIYFDKNGTRLIVTKELNTTTADYIQFYLRIGGTGNNQCRTSGNQEHGVLLSYSKDNGIVWLPLKYLVPVDFSQPRLVHLVLPGDARNSAVQFSLWQPRHEISNDQWAVDNIIIDSYVNNSKVQDDFERFDLFDGKDWLMATEGMLASFCQSASTALVFNNQNNDKFVQTTHMVIGPSTVIQFRINVGCSKMFSYQKPVMLQYSRDHGSKWTLVHAPCYPSDGVCNNKFTEGSIYYSGRGEWQLYTLVLDEKIIGRNVQFRWWQRGGIDSSFALDDVYIGESCRDHCNGHGLCSNGSCQCFEGFYGESCTRNNTGGSVGRFDRFDDMTDISSLWSHVMGASLSRGCSVIDFGNSLYFSGNGHREATTSELDLSAIRMLQFVIKIGGNDNSSTCFKPSHKNEAVIVDYTYNNGITRTLLEVLDPFLCCNTSQVVSLNLPKSAKSRHTAIRWWQPLVREGEPRTAWAIDSVILGINDTASSGFQDDFSPMSNNVWFMAQNAVPRLTCNKNDMSLEFSKTDSVQRYGETWDYNIKPSTFLQFDISLGCGGAYSTVYNVMLEYSVDMGLSWFPLAEKCIPHNTQCSGYHLSSNFLSETHMNWTRVTLSIPTKAISPSTRFRWLQTSPTTRGNIWALDNVYLGDGCEWMCSGHGYCNKAKCICDKGYNGTFCVPQIPLNKHLKDGFNSVLDRSLWPEVYGSDVTNICSVLVSGKSFTFYKDSIRLAVTQDLDATEMTMIQFTFQYGCRDNMAIWPLGHSVLLQYSNNGGITWILLSEMHHKSHYIKRFESINLPVAAMTNSTRFRFWQPQHSGHMQSVWSIDNLFIGGSMNPVVLYETFDGEPHPHYFHFWPGGTIDKFCSHNTRVDQVFSGTSSMAFLEETGSERSITTRDLTVGENTVIQFDINVGCQEVSSSLNSVLLEYSKDLGVTWETLIAPCVQTQCSDAVRDATIYYSGTSKQWRRIIIPLDGLQICGNVRLRWIQAPSSKSSIHTTKWALDNVYVGPACKEHCQGHGVCISGIICQCDEQYTGESCHLTSRKPTYLKEEFNGSFITETKWLFWSGGEISSKCIVFSDNSFHFIYNGDRFLVTKDLDLSHAMMIQFYIRLGCDSFLRNRPDQSVHVQYSNNGGISWRTVSMMKFNRTGTNRIEYVALHWPETARHNSSRIRWWQPSYNGTFSADWAIDQIYIGGNSRGKMVLQDDFRVLRDGYWLMYPGAGLDLFCHKPSLLFSAHMDRQYAVTVDMTVTKHTFIAFELNTGCGKNQDCYKIMLQYSLDMGKSWQNVYEECMLSNMRCHNYHIASEFSSDLFEKWRRTVIPLPYYTRSQTTRFRWLKMGRLSVLPWALSHVYIGTECESLCSGHGHCSRGQCQCDDGWIGEFCRSPKTQLPTTMHDNFNGDIDVSKWELVVGATLSHICGVVSSGEALHFTGACSRELITKHLNLVNILFVQFYFVFGCVSKPTVKDESVLVDYTTDGGINWKNFAVLHFNEYSKPRFISLLLPDDAKRNGIQIRLWQPKHTQNGSDWAIDQFVIGGSKESPNILLEQLKPFNSTNWLTFDNIDIKPFCNSIRSFLALPTNGESSTITTGDLQVEDDHIIQFNISIGCHNSDYCNPNPVHLLYSLDLGLSWAEVIPECSPQNPQCNGQETMASVYYSTQGWRRISIRLSGRVAYTRARFRWTQKSSSKQLAVNWVYIGPDCELSCSGNGWCTGQTCTCDIGYSGSDCSHIDHEVQDYIKDDFSLSVLPRDHWVVLEGVQISSMCLSSTQGYQLYFNGSGYKQAMLQAADLRNARFIEFDFKFFNVDDNRCHSNGTRNSNHSVVLQFSTDSITWYTIAVLKPSTETRFYHLLPQKARTISTHFRWWQPSTTSDGQLWFLDNVHIGGTEINPSALWEAFANVSESDKLWSFWPGGSIANEFCERNSMLMMWDKGLGEKKITTGPYIIQEKFIIQFKIKIGCDRQLNCDTLNNTIKLEYKTDPQSDEWYLVKQPCLPGATSACKPYNIGSIYSASNVQNWKRIVLKLPSSTFSSSTRFRWIQSLNTQLSWAIDDIGIGEECPDMCFGRGDCIKGKCHCDLNYKGPNCKPDSNGMLSQMVDGFEGGFNHFNWETVEGGGIGSGCGVLRPFAHGKSLYFSGCEERQAITREMNTIQARKIMFVLQIGSNRKTSTCNLTINATHSSTKNVLLQYTTNKGIDWHLIAYHSQDFLVARHLSYDIPQNARQVGTQFRWWQPVHSGQGFDQWAIDYVEIVMTRKDEMFQALQRRG